MKLIVYSASPPFEKFLRGHLDTEADIRRELKAPDNETDSCYLLHISSMELEVYEWLLRFVSGRPIPVGVCADVPNIREMLECVRLGAKAYCNSHMAVVHYRQMLQMLGQGQSWFPPQMLEETFKLAQQAVKPAPAQIPLDMLTEREKEIALAVADGKSNRQIADLYEISEPTVKTHLSNIFKKLELRDRVGLVLYLKQA